MPSIETIDKTGGYWSLPASNSATHDEFRNGTWRTQSQDCISDQFVLTCWI